ncbi:ComF family protein [Microbacterium sp. P05]|uniref:ComF family protein n=1 Tax=Microbacterium sp. P05 TaxID=3366948 RepID=UPI0037468AA6
MDRTLVSRALADALTFVLPVDCAGCDAPDIALCEECRSALQPEPFSQQLGSLRVWSGMRFEGVAARVLRALKEEGRTSLAPSLAPAITASLIRLGEADALLATMPTSRASMRRRGYRVTELLVRRAGLRPARVLRPTRATGDQRGLSAEERRANTAGSMIASGVRGRGVIVIDDVVTTGATLREAERALVAAGADVVGAVTVAATPLHLRRRPRNAGFGETSVSPVTRRGGETTVGEPEGDG